MFLTEGATQYTAEILYHVSKGTNKQYREQSGVVRGQKTILLIVYYQNIN